MELLKDLKATLWDRVNSQVFGVYLLTWITYNYDITLSIFSSELRLEDKITILDQSLKVDFFWNDTYWMPALFTLLILLLYPIVSLAHILWMKKTTQWKSSIYKQFESLASKEELEELRLKHEKEIEQKGKTYEYNKESLKTRHIDELAVKDEQLNDILKTSSEKDNKISELSDKYSKTYKLLESEKSEFARVNSKTGLDFEPVRHLCKEIVKYRNNLAEDFRPDLAIESILKMLPNELSKNQINSIKSQSEELINPYIHYKDSNIEHIVGLLFNQSSETKYDNTKEMKSIRKKISDTRSLVEANIRTNPLDSIRLGQPDNTGLQGLTEILSPKD